MGVFLTVLKTQYILRKKAKKLMTPGTLLVFACAVCSHFKIMFFGCLDSFDGRLFSLDGSGNLSFVFYFFAVVILFLDFLAYVLLPFAFFLVSLFRGLVS
jgi:hypothetical protein